MPTTVRFAGTFALAACMTLCMGEPAAREPAPTPAMVGRMHAYLPSTPPDARLYFRIAAQPLHGALERYGTATGWSAFYNADAITGATSTALDGWFTPDAALERLIEGTGLAVQHTAPDAFVLEPSTATASAAPPTPTALAPDTVSAGLVQAGLRALLCDDARIAPGDYRAAVSFRLDGRGRVEAPMLLDSTGDPSRDAALLAALRRLDTGHAPADASLPFVMLIVPGAGASARDCPRGARP